MKKKYFTCLLSMISILTGLSQNIQLHYDLGHSIYGDLNGRPNVTTTVEMFKPDRFGSTFLFTDIDYFGDGAAGAYWEIAREFNLRKENSRWAAHIEYNGGLSSVEDMAVATRFQHAALAGLAWNWHSGDFQHTFSMQAMYKHYFKGQYRDGFPGFQLTAVWNDTFAHGFCTFSGFCDLWHDKDVDGKLILLAEPQFWLNLNALNGMKDIHLSVGTEVELSNNFVFNKNEKNNMFYAIPTLAAKWTF